MKQFIWLLLSILSFNVLSAPKSELWEYWDQSNEKTTLTFSHDQWQKFLDKYLVEKGEHNLVRYSNVTTEDELELKQYIQGQAQLNPLQYSTSEQYAYWVNLYNAITVDLILEAYPIKSITKLGGIFSFGPWAEEVVTVNGKYLSLNDIEHRILRPIWQDPRTHYAVNCASLGCPNLQPKAFTSSNTQALLEQAASGFINSNKGVLIQDGEVQLSSIYEWFIDDFGNEEQLIQHLNRYLDSPVQYQGKFKYNYDWSLNQSE